MSVDFVVLVSDGKVDILQMVNSFSFLIDNMQNDKHGMSEDKVHVLLGIELCKCSLRTINDQKEFSQLYSRNHC